MGHRQTRRKLDEIVAFSEIEEFLDTPVKRYSSGMNARLGFSIAAHLDPDVLIIDEVLAVGDYAFQRKAFGRLRELARSGLPVVVVSHQLERIAELWTEVLLLSRGTMSRMGSPADVIAAYMRDTDAPATSTATDSPVVIDAVATPDGNAVASGERVRIRITGTAADRFLATLSPSSSSSAARRPASWSSPPGRQCTAWTSTKANSPSTFACR